MLVYFLGFNHTV